MFDFGKSLLALGADEQQKALDSATPDQCRSASGMRVGVGFNNRFKGDGRERTRRQKRDAYRDLDRLNHIVEAENDAHDFFTRGLADWRKGVTGKDPSGDATTLKKQFDDYERTTLSTVPKGGRRHAALSESLPRIKDTFLKQGRQFALDKLNERSRTVLDKGLRRIAKGTLGARDEKAVQAHDGAAFDLINKYVLSEAGFDEKDADAAYEKYLGYSGIDGKKAEADGAKEIHGAKPGFDIKDAVKLVENDTGTANDTGGEAEAKGKNADLQIPEGQDEVYDGSPHREKVNIMDTETQQPDQSGKSEGDKSGAEAKEKDQLEGYLGALGQREASGKYNTKNSLGYLGKYQMGPATLTDTGYVKEGKWTGKDGIRSEKDFLNSPEVQEKAIRVLVNKQWRHAKGEGLDRYVGKTINGIKITKSGIIAAVHLKGAHGAKPFFETNGKIDPKDRYKTPVSEYIKKMGGFHLLFTEDNKGDE